METTAMTEHLDRSTSGQPPATGAVRSPDPRVRNALVVDASAGARRRVRTVLRLGGWRVHEAIDVIDALRQAAHLDLDLVVTDMTLPDGDGAALLRRLRADGCSARFLAVSAEGTAQVRVRAAAAGASGCLAKPVDPRQLVEHLLRSADEPGTAAHEGPGSDDGTPPLHVPAERIDQDRAAYMTALPHRINAVVSSIHAGNLAATASAAYLLAKASERVGQDGVARVCEAIAADAQRGVLARARVTQLVALSAGAHRGIAALPA
jgi:CheY-like chemotaxis protein